MEDKSPIQCFESACGSGSESLGLLE
jgi:hypothetical protein